MDFHEPEAARDDDEQRTGHPIFELLRQDHEDITRLFNAIEASIDPDERLVISQELIRDLRLHSTAEADVFYERLENEPASRTRLMESRQEHEDIDLQLDRLAQADDDDDLLDLIADLRIAVDHHVRSEEDEVFAAAQALLDKDEARTLGVAFASRKRTLALALADDVATAGPRVGDGIVLPLSGVELDAGLEDRGVGSDGSTPQAPTSSPLGGLAGGELDQGLEDRGVGAGPHQKPAQKRARE
ncbi:MAG: hemerythrin domain-containing protein [Deltaproteobacteria bacterium]|nr:hemerythrin domain-containing protein [Deltaproteobacteria bacterium]